MAEYMGFRQVSAFSRVRRAVEARLEWVRCCDQEVSLTDLQFKRVWPALVVEFALRIADQFSFVYAGCNEFNSISTIEGEERKPRADRRRFCQGCGVGGWV